MHLKDYPRPANDNGMGIHFGLDVRQLALETYIPKMVDLRLKWCLVPHQDELQLYFAAQKIAAAGIMPLSRWICKIDQSILDFVRFVQGFKSLGLPAYIQIFNEPGDPREWKSGSPNFDLYVHRWIQHATAVAEAGGFPGIQLLDPSELRTLLRALRSAGANTVIDRLWFCLHNYGANHPPDYPYDALNQQEHPGSTVFEDDITVINLLEFEPIFRQELGIVPPFIACEGGWQYLNSEDNRYPPVDDQLHAEYHAALFNSFRSGKLPNGDPLPDYFFAACPWIFFGGERDAWYSWSSGTRLQTVIAIQAIPPFIRRFNWDASTPKEIDHMLLFGSPNARSTRSILLGSRKYIYQFGPALGFSVADATKAQYVTIVGDSRAVPSSVDALLESAGCRVERLEGDQYQLDAVFGDRVARNTEFG